MKSVGLLQIDKCRLPSTTCRHFVRCEIMVPLASLSRQIGVDRKAMHHMDLHMLVLRSECLLITHLPSVGIF